MAVSGAVSRLVHPVASAPVSPLGRAPPHRPRSRGRVARQAGGDRLWQSVVSNCFLRLPSRSARPRPGGSVNEAPSTAPPAEPQRPPPHAGWRDRLDGLAHRAGINVSPARLVAVALAVAAAISLAVFV